MNEKLQRYIQDTQLEAQKALANLPPTPWYKRWQYWLDYPLVFDWWTFLWALVIFKILFG